MSRIDSKCRIARPQWSCPASQSAKTLYAFLAHSLDADFFKCSLSLAGEVFRVHLQILDALSLHAPFEQVLSMGELVAMSRYGLSLHIPRHTEVPSA
eukprot:1194457-Rhodomonas_salina.1